MEVEIEADPSPQTPVKSPGRRTIPIIIEQRATVSSQRVEETVNSESAGPSFVSPESLTTTTSDRIRCYEDNRYQEFMEREYERITHSIDYMIHSQYTTLSTKMFMGFLFMAICLLILIAMVANSRLPKGLKEIDPGSMDNGRVKSDEAMKYLKDLTNFGPKLIGSYENEYLAVNYLKRELERIKLEAPDEWNEIEIDIQVSSGSFTEGPNRAKNYLKQIVYQNVQNVVAKLSPKGYVAESILVNCHFDTFFTSPGTSDDGLNCAVMLEVLRVMSKVYYPLKRNVIFLFNGAEEDGVSGSHGFITKHKWINEIICFVNLDAGGAGGRQRLFQTGPRSSVLPKIYSSSVPHPTANVIGEELFQSGMVPSGTDFVIFHDFSKRKLKGLDFAHMGNGYVYHTSSDNISMITPDVVQLTGDNLLALLRALDEYNHLKKDLLTDNYQAIYYDIFGFFVIRYSTYVGFLINMVVAFVSIYCCFSKLYCIFRGKPVKLMLHHVLIDLVFVVSGILAVTMVLYLLALLLKLKDATMLWYSHQWFVLSYYGSPVLLVMFVAVKVRREFIHSLLNGEQEAKVFIFVIQFIMTVILSLGTVSGIRSSFILAIGLIGVSISHYFLNKTKLKFEIAVYKFITYGMINLVPAVYCAYVFVPFIQSIIPMMGRMGAGFDGEDVIWIVTEVLVLITFAYFIPLVLMVKEFWTMQYVFTAIYIAQMIFIFVHGLSPFSDTAPERLYALHVDRKLVYGENTLKNETSGYLVSPADIRGGNNILNLFKEHKFQQVKYTDNCNRELFCGMPTLISTTPGLLERHLSFWAPKEAPKIPHLKQLNCTTQDNGYDFKTFNLTLNGSKFMDVVILPLNGAKLVQWSFNPPIPGNDLKWNRQQAYFIRYHEGSLNRSSLSFSMKFDVLNMLNKNKHVFKLAWSVFYPTNTTDTYTPQFKKFVDEFPSWSRVVPMVVEYEEFLLPELS